MLFTNTQSEEIIATMAIINIASAAIINIVITITGKTGTTTSDKTVAVIATKQRYFPASRCYGGRAVSRPP